MRKGEEGREGKGDGKGRGHMKGGRENEEVAEEGKGEASEWEIQHGNIERKRWVVGKGEGEGYSSKGRTR